MLSNPCPGCLGQVAGIWLFFLSAASSQPSSHGIVNSIRMIFFPSGDHMMMSGLRVVDSTTSGKRSFLWRSTYISPPWADCRRFCLACLWTTGFWPFFTKAMVLSRPVVLLWLVVSSSFLATGYLQTLPICCHGSTCISPVSIRSYTLTGCVP